MSDYGKQKEKIIPLLKQGLSYKKISEQTGASKSTISYHAQKLALPTRPIERLGFRKKYDWAKVQEYYDHGHTVRSCMKHFGFYAKTWEKAVARGDIKTRPRLLPLKDIMVEGSTYSRSSLKARLLNERILLNKCYNEGCPLAYENPIWMNEPVGMWLDHINGVYNDHRLENLRLLCPNCTAQTETFSNKGGRFYKK